MIKKSKSKKCTVCDKIISIYRESVGCAGYKQKILDSEGGVFFTTTEYEKIVKKWHDIKPRETIKTMVRGVWFCNECWEQVRK